MTCIDYSIVRIQKSKGTIQKGAVQTRVFKELKVRSDAMEE